MTPSITSDQSNAVYCIGHMDLIVKVERVLAMQEAAATRQDRMQSSIDDVYSIMHKDHQDAATARINAADKLARVHADEIDADHELEKKVSVLSTKLGMAWLLVVTGISVIGVGIQLYEAFKK